MTTLGVELGSRWTAIDAVGLYVPGGTASYPSSVLMNAVPARVAGVERIVMTVPAPDGRLNPLVLAAAHLAGVHEVLRVGGAQAIAALAYGTETIRASFEDRRSRQRLCCRSQAPCLRACGNRSDRRSVRGAGSGRRRQRSGLDRLPISWRRRSTTPPHKPSSSPTTRVSAGAVEIAVTRQLSLLPRGETAGASWRDFGAVIVVKQLADAVPVINRIAPEHLELAIADPKELLASVRNAGAIFLGRHTPEAIGDYVAGPNHVLPTARSARFSSGLSVLDFMKRTSIAGCSAEALRQLAPAAIRLAEAEGLQAHARSVSIRLNL